MENAPEIKTELRDASPSLLDDDDVYEDAGDLEFFDPSSSQKNLYLARLPTKLWEAWSKLDDDAEIQIGTIRQWYETKPDSSVPEV
jgi:transcription initiation factor TFIIF subunit beta